MDKLNDNVWVLDPDYDYDLLKIIFDEMHLNAEEKDRYDKWLAEYKQNSCVKKCPVIDSPRCCCVCPDKYDCEEILSRCGDLDKVNGLKTCSKRGKYNEPK